YGNQRGLTPFLDRIAQRGTVFERAYAVSPWTVPSVASLIMSRYPSQHHVVTFGSRIGDDEVTFAERLQRAGWTGGGFAANPTLKARWGWGRGCVEWRADVTDKAGLDGDTLRAQCIEWLDHVRQRSSRPPVLLYLHYMDPHEPYPPAEPFRSRFA